MYDQGFVFRQQGAAPDGWAHAHPPVSLLNVVRSSHRSEAEWSE